MRVNLLKLWTILICFYIGKSDFVGRLKISGFFPEQNSEVLCLGTTDEITGKIQVVRCSQVTNNVEGSVAIWFQDDEIFSHLLILDGKSWEKMNPSIGSTIVMNEFDGNDFNYAILPLLLPNQERNLSIYTDKATDMIMSLECISNHYGPRCVIICDPAISQGRYRCDGQSGEKICVVGWSGEDCLKKTANGKMFELAKSRPKRSECLEPPCEDEETEFLLEGTVERDFRGPESITHCNDTCDYPGTHICVVDEEEGTICKCSPGYSGETCAVMDRCHFEVCQNGADCQKSENGESICVCLAGYSGEFCESEIDNCIDDPCGEYGTCESDVTGFRCTCDVGFEGENCEANIDDCADDPCSGHGECYDGINSYDCDCFRGYHGPNCEEKEDACSDNPCRNGGTCGAEGQDFTCECPEGYEGLTCETESRDPCDPDPCNGHGTCYAELEESYTEEMNQKVAYCACNPRYMGDYCETKVSFCDVSGACPSNSSCVSRNGEFTCICPTGYQGEFCEEECEDCEDANDLLCEEDPCKNGGRCVAIAEEIRCICQHGFQGSRCDYKIDYCLEHPCGEHGLCQSTTDGFKCLCQEGFRGDRCEEDVNECELSINLCKNDGVCVNEVAGYRCDCTKGYFGSHCENFIDACTDKPCHNGGTCVTEIDMSYTCHCKPGYHGFHCEHKIPCEENPCQNGGECDLDHDLGQGYRCICESPYHGIHCEKKIHPCTVKRRQIDGTYDYVPRTDCGSNGICQAAGDDDFTCECLPGYQGEFCARKITITDCNEPYCVCGATISNGKFMNRNDKIGSACTHPSYGSGTCASNDCISKSCNNPPQLLCEYDSQCEYNPRTDITTRTLQGRYGVCARMLISFSRAELPSETTVQGICEMLRHTKPLKDIVSVATKCFLHSINDISTVMSLSFEATLKLNARNAREKFLKYLKNLILKNDFTEITDETTVMIFEAIDNITDGSSVIRARKLNRPTKPEAPRQTSTSKKTLIITVVCVAMFIVSASIIGVIIWIKKRKPAMTSSPVISRAENNNVPIDSVKFSKTSNGKVNSLLYASNAKVFYVKTDEVKAIPPHTSAQSTEATNRSQTTNTTPPIPFQNQR